MYVGRGTPFGNPFVLHDVEDDRERARVVNEFEKWLMGEFDLLTRVHRELRGKDLVCWCAPKACHADVLLRIANQ